jgi:hypothetical protein
MYFNKKVDNLKIGYQIKEILFRFKESKKQ